MSTRPVKKLRNSSTMFKKIKKLYSVNLSKKEYIYLLLLVNLYDFCLEKIVAYDSDLLGNFS